MRDSLPVLFVQTQCASADPVRAHLNPHSPPHFLLVCAESLADALAQLAQHEFAAILLALELPDAQDLDAFITLHLRVPEIPIVVFAETLEPERARAALRSGAQDCLTRAQVESADIRRVLQFAIERNTLQSETHSHAEHLQYSEARFRLLINENADAIIVVNHAGVVRFVNPAAAELFGKARQELVGSTFSTSLRDDATTVRLARNGASVIAQQRVAEMLWDGEHTLLVTLRDVTEQQRIADALRASQERYREFLSASSEGIWRCEFRKPLSMHVPLQEQIHAIFHDTYIAECNMAMANMYGFGEPAELIGWTTAQLVAPQDPRNQEYMAAFVNGGYRVTGAESHERDRYGNHRIFRNTVYGILRDEHLVSMWGIQRDVTDQPRTRHAPHVNGAQEHQRKMALALADSAAVLNSTLGYEQVLDRILDNVGRVVPHDAASMFLVQDGIAQYVRGKGFREREMETQMAGLRLAVQEIPGYKKMIDSGAPLLVPNTDDSEIWTDLTGGWIKSYVGVPLRVQNDTIGFLNLDSGTRNFFTTAHAAELQAFAAHAATALNNARLHAQVQQRAEEFAALYELTRELSVQRDLDTLLETLVDRAMALLNASCGEIALYLPADQEVEVRVIRGSLDIPLGTRMKLGEGTQGTVARTHEPLILEDYRTSDYRLAKLGKSQVSASLSVPMLFGGELIGVLSVCEWGDTKRRYMDADAQLLLLLAAQAAALVHNARLYEETQKRAQQMGLLYDAGLTLNSVLEPQMQLDFLMRIAMRSVRADLAAFFRYAEDTRELIFELGLGYTDAQPYNYARRVPLNASQGIEAWVARERIPATLNDAPSDPRFFNGKDPLVSGIWVPIEHDKQLLGILTVGSTRRNAFTPHDERLLLLYASQAAVAMENARLYQEALQANDRLTVLHWASQEIISAGLDAERVYTAIHQAVSRLMPCEAFVLAVLDDAGEVIQLPYLYDRGGRQPAGTVAKSVGLSGYMLSTGVPLVIDDLAASGITPVNFGYPVPVVSVLAVPLQHGGRVFGMLSTQSYEYGVYHEQDRATLEMLAAHAAAALLNVKRAGTRL